MLFVGGFLLDLNLLKSKYERTIILSKITVFGKFIIVCKKKKNLTQVMGGNFIERERFF